MKKFLKYIFGILLAIIFPTLGILVTKYIENGIATILAIISITLIGLYLLKSKHREIGIGILIGIVPVVFITLVFIFISNLH